MHEDAKLKDREGPLRVRDAGEKGGISSIEEALAILERHASKKGKKDKKKKKKKKKSEKDKSKKAKKSKKASSSPSGSDSGSSD